MKKEKAIKYFKLAKCLANEFSKDPSTKVGAIFLDPKTHAVLSLGYNGFPRGIDETQPKRWERPKKYMYCEHAERNGIYNACLNGTCLKDSIAIITMYPCCDCARAIIQSGIKTIVTVFPNYDDVQWGESFKISNEMFTELGIEMIYLSQDEII